MRRCWTWPDVDACVLTVDLLTDGVDFELAAGYAASGPAAKSLAVNLSDLAAMAARPLAA